MIKLCLFCQSLSPKSVPEPICSSSMPEIIHVNLCRPFSTSEEKVLLSLSLFQFSWRNYQVPPLNIFDASLPELITPDNGPTMCLEDPCRFPWCTWYSTLKSHSILVPEVEHFNQPSEKMIGTVHVKCKDWWQEIYKFLMNYCAIPHIVAGIASCWLPSFLNLWWLTPSLSPMKWPCQESPARSIYRWLPATCFLSHERKWYSPTPTAALG